VEALLNALKYCLTGLLVFFLAARLIREQFRSSELVCAAMLIGAALIIAATMH
jgi:hypothetical protein